MCGIAGIISLKTEGRVDPGAATRMAEVLAHRGPDGLGEYVDGQKSVALSFRRLSVIDLNTGMQPIANEDGSVHVVCNGEIYNFKSLRDGLSARGHRLTTAGDIEPIVHLYEQYGEKFLDHLDGFFALALYDERKMKVILAVDRMGKKPLYYTVVDGYLYFASELKSIVCVLPGLQIDKSALIDYLRFGYIPAPKTIFEQVKKILPGHRLDIPLNYHRGLLIPALPPPVRYYSPETVFFTGSYHAARSRLTTLLTDAVTKRMVADVPLGILLSGGLDSSIVTALASRHSSTPVKTFSVGFQSERYNELPLAGLVARKYKTDHTDLMVEPDLASMLDLVFSIYDEPFADSSAIPTYLICRRARKHVTVVLTGDGGDEAFYGYDRYRAMGLAKMMAQVRWGHKIIRSWFSPGSDLRSTQTRLWRFSQTLALSPAKQYSMLMRIFYEHQLDELAAPELKPFLALQPDFVTCTFDSFTEQPSSSAKANLCDFQTYLPGDLLVKIDRASMANSLEVRSPFLDRALLEFSKSLPGRYKMGLRKGKRILRDTFGHLLPPEILRAPKRGFGVPLGEWLRGPLESQMRSILGRNARIIQQNLINYETLNHLIDDHLAGHGDHSARLWSLMILEKFLSISDSARTVRPGNS